MNQFFQQKHAAMLRAGQHADVCLLSSGDGWIAMGRCAATASLALGIPVVEGLQITITPTDMPQAIKALQDAGHSVALLEYWSDSMGKKPQPTLIFRFPGKTVDEDWV